MKAIESRARFWNQCSKTGHARGPQERRVLFSNTAHPGGSAKIGSCRVQRAHGLPRALVTWWESSNIPLLIQGPEELLEFFRFSLFHSVGVLFLRKLRFFYVTHILGYRLYDQIR